MAWQLTSVTFNRLSAVFYALIVAIIFRFSHLLDVPGLSVVSMTFILVYPFVSGMVTGWLATSEEPDPKNRNMFVLGLQSLLIVILVSLFTLIEGVICLIIASPAFLLFGGCGGVLGSFLQQKFSDRSRNKVLSSILLLPLVMSPIEAKWVDLSFVYTVEDEIVVQATPEQVFAELAAVSTIADDELPLTFTHLIGIPKPVRADMHSSPEAGAIRTSYWEKGVTFQEQITQWQPSKRMYYRFIFDQATMPDDALDQHIKLGGKYFSPLTGGYDIAVNEQGETVLKLHTVIQDRTNYSWYSRIWGEFIFSDFHRGLLKMMKARAEAKTS